MKNIKNKKEIKSNKKKLDSSYAWISFILTLFFWVPLLNIFFILPASIYFGINAIRRAKKEPKKYGGFALALFSVTWSSISFIFGVIVSTLSFQGKI